jgi:hypothetical protein
MAVLRMARSERGCGYRKKGGTYLFCDVDAVIPCPSLPIGLPDRCPVCGEEIEMFRGIKVINPQKFFTNPQKVMIKCNPMAVSKCVACYPPELGALMWVGKKYYTKDLFMQESVRMGISKRIAKIPKGLAPGNPIYFVHPEAFPPEAGKVRGTPGIFTAARISAFHRIIDEAQEKDEKFIKELEDQGITPVIEYDPEVLV